MGLHIFIWKPKGVGLYRRYSPNIFIYIHIMIQKILTIFLIFASFAFAKISALEDSVQDTTSTDLNIFYENKYNPFSVLFLGGAGYTSTRRFEVDVLCISATNMGSKLFGIDRLLIDYTFLRFDRRLNRTEDGKEIYEASIGSIASSLLGFAFLGLADSAESTAGKIGLGTLWLTSGQTKYVLWGNNLAGVSLAESHAIEWFIRNEERDNKSHYSFKEFGFIEEVGIQFGLLFVQVTTGASFEITNKQRNIGWFVKIITLPIPMESPRHWQNEDKKRN